MTALVLFVLPLVILLILGQILIAIADFMVDMGGKVFRQ